MCLLLASMAQRAAEPSIVCRYGACAPLLRIAGALLTSPPLLGTLAVAAAPTGYEFESPPISQASSPEPSHPTRHLCLRPSITSVWPLSHALRHTWVAALPRPPLSHALRPPDETSLPRHPNKIRCALTSHANPSTVPPTSLRCSWS